MSRPAAIAAFLAIAGWEQAHIEPFDADFSPRRYARLQKADGSTAILMDAEANQKTLEFVRLAKMLREAGLSAPDIYADQAPQGLVLLEDFGSANVGKLLDEGADGVPFYRKAAEVLAHLHQQTPASFWRKPEASGAIGNRSSQIFACDSGGQSAWIPACAGMTLEENDPPHFTPELFATQAEKFLDDYLPYVLQREATQTEREIFHNLWLDLLRPTEALPQSLLLRDFMPDNVMQLPKRAGVQALGLLDFQDAGIGCIAYDIASFCEVVRRDGGDSYLEIMLAHYHDIAKPDCLLDTLRHACLLFSAQRHLRILGILAGLVRAGRVDKSAYLPRVCGYLNNLLRDEALYPLRDWLAQNKISLSSL